MSDKVIPVKVALRIRPLVPREKADACTECLRTVRGEPQVILGKDKAFTYDYIFDQNTPQLDVYETAVQSLLNSLFKGYNATVLAYGQTGSGKTYTMGSSYLSLNAAVNGQRMDQTDGFGQLDINGLDDVGVIPRVLNDLFMKIDDEQRAEPNAKFNVKVSFVEVYNEEIKDLFSMKSSSSSCEPLNIREENNSIKVVNLSEIDVKNALATIQLLERGSSLRVVGGTAMNDQSSRSHAIFTITLEQIRGENEMIRSKFHLVDLAGSERQSKTKAEGIRLKEGININLGLLALGNVISVLGEDNPMNKIKHVPYRESKLTRLLQDSLGGNSHTLMIACVSPADSNAEESLNTLRYADRARKIKNKPIVNIDPQAAELAQLRQQVIELKAHILQINGGVAFTASSTISDNNCLSEIQHYKEENERLKTENIKLLSELNKMIQSNRITYERMMQLSNEKEELTRKFDEIKSTFVKLSKESPSLIGIDGESSNSNQEDALAQGSQNKSLMLELQNKLGEYDQLKEKCEKINVDEEDDANNNEMIKLEAEDKDYAFRQAQWQVKLTEFDSELMRKQQLVQRMLENNINSKLDSQMEDLQKKIDSLEKEKASLLNQIDSAKLNDQKRDRLKQLENEVIDLKRKEREFQRMSKMREENDKHCEKLKQEIQHIKQERVKLLKQMKSDTDQFRKYKQEKEKEVNQLKALERKRLVEISKLQEGNNRQEAVLRRKNEEISRIQRQLRETAEKQKQVAEKRQQAFDRKESSALGEKLRGWISNELELSVGLAEARINLNKLLEERKESAAELSRLQEKLAEYQSNNDEQQPTATKRKYLGTDMDSTYITNSPALSSQSASPSRFNKTQLEQRIERLKEDIECKNVQITEIQQMVLEGDQVDDRSKHIFNNIHGLLEAKVLLKHLYSCGVQYLLDLKLKQTQYDTTSNSLNQELKDLKKKYESMEEDFNKSKKTFSTELDNLTRYYEQRILFTINAALNDPTYSNDDRFNVLYENLKLLEKKMEKDTFAEPLPVSLKKRHDSTFVNDENSLDYKRKQKLKRDHRRTRVIRTGANLLSEEMNPPSSITSNGYLGINTIPEALSPANRNSPVPWDDVSIGMTPDDKSKDPDWGNTPLRVKRRTTILAKKTSIMRKSRSSNRVLATDPKMPLASITNEPMDTFPSNLSATTINE